MSGRSLLLVLDIIVAQSLTVADLLVLLSIEKGGYVGRELLGLMSIEKGGYVGRELLGLMLEAGVVTVGVDQQVRITAIGLQLRRSLPGIADRIAELEVS